MLDECHGPRYQSFAVPSAGPAVLSAFYGGMYSAAEWPSALHKKHKPGVQPGLLILVSTPQHRRRNDRFRYDWSQAARRLLSSPQAPLDIGPGERKLFESAMGYWSGEAGLARGEDFLHVFLLAASLTRAWKTTPAIVDATDGGMADC